jgi:hypothetical protein
VRIDQQEGNRAAANGVRTRVSTAESRVMQYVPRMFYVITAAVGVCASVPVGSTSRTTHRHRQHDHK